MAYEPWRDEPSVDASARARRPYRPPVGMPTRSEKSWRSTLVAIGLHLLILLAIITPWAVPAVIEQIQGAGGEGPAGGGGGGTLGSGGRQGRMVQERVHYIPIAPAPPVPKATTPTPPVPPPPIPQPTPVPPPPPVRPVQPTAQPAAPAASPQTGSDVASSAPTPGTGGGTGSDGSAGSGPGSGGGVGAGVGTGRGSGIGPGTGGGTGEIYPPQATEVFIPPLPVPGKVRGTRLVAVFDVDSTGRVLDFEFTQTKDGGYNRKLREVLAGFRFRPGTRGDGTPVRAKGQIIYDL